MAKRIDFSAQTDEIVSRLDILAEYRLLGVQFVSSSPRSSGMIECYGYGREDKKPSAWVNVNSARYGDSATSESLSLFDFAAKYHPGRFPTWQDARKHYAEKVGVKLTGAKPPEDPAEAIEWAEWDAGCERQANNWCAFHKPGITLEALKLCGVRVGRYPRYRNRKTGDFEFSHNAGRVIALPCYGENLLNDDPVAWVIWAINGNKLDVFRGKGNPPDKVKMKSIGPTRGAMMGFHALSRLANPGDTPIEWIIKTGGPTDMLTALSFMPPELRETHLVLTNASSESGDVLPHQAKLFEGHRALLVHDCDKAGEMGNTKWTNALDGIAKEVWIKELPWPVKEKGGEDLRDYLLGRPADGSAAAPLDEQPENIENEAA